MLLENYTELIETYSSSLFCWLILVFPLDIVLLV